MKTDLLTEAIKNSLPRLYATEEVGLNDKVVICKWFCGNLTWFCCEGEPIEDEPGDWMFFGYVKNEADDFCSEFGYWTLFQLMELALEKRRKLPFIELDEHFKPAKLIDLIGKRF